MSAGWARPPGSGEAETRITVDLLHAVQHDGALSQRSLARQLNVALGLTNAYLKRCVRRGWVKMRKAPPNRYAYYLTPQGFSEKSRLTARYLASSFRFYRRARNECDALLGEAADRGHRRIALAGAGELAEIALLCAMQYELEVAGVVDPSIRTNRFRHVALVRDLDSLLPVDAVLVADLKRPQQVFDSLAGRLEPDRLLTPPLLKISRASARPHDEGTLR